MGNITECPIRRYDSETGRGNPIPGSQFNRRVTVKVFLSTLLLSLFLILLGPVGTIAAEHTLFFEPEFVASETIPLVSSSEVRRWQEVRLNPVIADAEAMMKGDIVKINPFPDVEYYAIVDSMESNINGTVTVRASLDAYPYGYLMISTSSDQRSLGTIRIPERGERYSITSMAGGDRSAILELDSERMDKLRSGTPLELEDPVMMADEPVIPYDEGEEDFADPGDFGPEDQATIDVMVVYTPAARIWAENAGGINNIIAQAMEKSQLTLDNSETYVNLNLVHSAEVNYSESGDSSTDLVRLRNQGDGYMEGVHALRDAYQADLVALFAVLHDVGGRAYLLNSRDGRPDSAFSITRVQQAGFSYTFMHELAHNMGLHHSKGQNESSGPTLWLNWPENRWSAGWEWIGRNGNHYASLMTYESGTYFDDGIHRTRVAHISNPNVNHVGVPTGDRVDGDNARTLREMKHIVAAYRRGAVRTYTLTYEAGDGGFIEGNVRQTIREGEDGTAVEAVPDDGYYFVQWNDGRTDNPRIDRNITTDMVITANFNRRVVNTYTLTYEAGDGGFIKGNVRQTIREGEDGTAVEAVPDDGYYFVQWNDGRTDNPRIDRDITTNMVITADYAKSFAGGEGTPENPFLISNSEQLARVRYDLDKHFKLQNDIDLEKLNREPIGTSNDPFTGVFDGNGHVIKNLFVDGGDFIDTGMFGYARDAEIRNTAIENVDVKGGDNVGGLVGYAVDTIIEQSFVTGFVSGRENVGGLLGFLVKEVSETMVLNSYADCDVVGISSVGGLVGKLGSMARIENAYAVGSMTGDNDVGGLVGQNGNESHANVINSYWDTDIGPSTSKGGTGKTTVLMRRKNTFVDWNFDDVWGIREDETYPYLQLWPAQGGGTGSESSRGYESSLGCFINTLIILDNDY